MKKALLVIFTVVALVVFFTACSVTENESETVSTTAITDENGETHYFEIVTDAENQTVLNEIKIDESGKPVTNKSGTYETVSNHKSSAADVSTGSANPADNEVTFESMPDSSEKDTGYTQIEKFTTSERSTEGIHPATDADGWVNKWY